MEKFQRSDFFAREIMHLLKAILETDLKLSTSLRLAEKPGILRNIAIFFAHSGDSWFWGAGLVILWVLGSRAWKDWAAIQLLSIVLLAVLVLAFKFSVRRQRPAGDWGSIYRTTDPHSFPSGHAARAFLIAALSLGLGPCWLAVILCFWAPLVAMARVAMGVHYVSDIAAGGILGMAMGFIFFQFSGWMAASVNGLLAPLL